MADQTVTVRLRADIAAYKAAMLEATRSTDAMSKAGQAQLTRLGGGMQKVGRNLTKYVSVPLVAIGAGAVYAAVQWESSWAGVTKTVNGTAKELATLETGLRDMAKEELPASHTEIAAVAEAAGQLGVETPRILGFTKTMIDLGETTDLTADQAASALARLANITQMPQTQFDRLGATVVDLGNKSASTESEIVNMSLGLAAAGSQVGLTEAQILAFAASLSSVGIEAEAGGSSFSRVFTTMGDAVQDQSKKLQTFAQVAGVSADEFSTAFRDDAGAAIAMFIQGLGQMTDRGESVTKFLEQLGFSDIRVTRALKSIAGAGDLVNNMLATGTKAWDQNSALTVEAEKRYQTTAAELEKLRNKAVDLGIDVGGLLVPALSGLVDVGSGVVSWLQDLDPGTQKAALGMGVLVASVGPVLTVTGGLIKNLKSLGTGLQVLATGKGIFPGFFNPVIALSAAAGAGLLYAYNRSKALTESFTTSSGASEALADSLGITLKALDDLSAGADEAAGKTEMAFAEINAKAIKTLRDLESDLDTDAFILEIGYEMVARGAKPKDVLEEITRLAEAAGVEIPFGLKASDLTKFDTQLEAVRTNTTRLAGDIADTWVNGSAGITRDIKLGMADIADSIQLAFSMDNVKGGVQILMEVEDAMKEAGLEGANLRNAMALLWQTFISSSGITGVSVSDFDSMGEAIARLAGEESSLSSKHKALIADFVNTGPVAESAEIMGGWIDLVTGKSGKLAGSVLNAKGASDQHASSLRDEGDAAGYTAGQIEKVTSALQDNFDVLRGGLDAEITYQQAIDDLGAAFENQNGRITEASRSFDLHTQSGRDNANAMRDVGTAIVGLMQQRIEEGGTIRDAVAVGDMYVANLKEQMRQAGYTDAEIDMLVAAYGLVPGDIATHIKADGLPEETEKVGKHRKQVQDTDGETANTKVNAETETAWQHLQSIKDQLAGIQSKTVTVTVAQVQGPAPGAVHSMPEERASGGPVNAGQMYLVGEEGPELVTFSSAGIVHDATDTARMLKGAGDGGQRLGMSIGLGLGDGIAGGVFRSIPKVGSALRSMDSDLLAHMDTLAQQLSQAAEDAVSDAWADVVMHDTRDEVRQALHDAEAEVNRTKRQLANARDAERAAARRVHSLSDPITDTRLDSRITTTKRMLARARAAGDADNELNASWDLGVLQEQRAAILAEKNAARRGKLRDAKADQRAARDQVADLKDQLGGARDAVEDAARSFVEASTSMITKSAESRQEWIRLARQAGLTAGEIDSLVAAYQNLDRVQGTTGPVTGAARHRASIAEAVATVFAQVGAELDTDVADRLAQRVHSGRMDMGGVRKRAQQLLAQQRAAEAAEKREAQLAKLEKRVENLFHAHNQSISDYDAKQAAAKLLAGTQSWEALEAFVAALPARALGGPVRAGGMYLVGERGPEIFRADRDGRIMPNSQTGAYLAGGRGPGDALVAELRALREDVQRMRAINVNGVGSDEVATEAGRRVGREIAFAATTGGV